MDSEKKNRKSFAEKRFQLVKSLKNKGINDIKLLDVINSLPREIFVEPAFINRAYDDTALPISNQQTISQPFTVAYMTQLLEVKAGDRILEIGTGSGYQAALLSMIGAEVFTIERIKSLSEKAYKKFLGLELDIHCFIGDGSIGLPEYSPYDKIIVTASAPVLPQTLIKQLTISGRLVIPIGNKDFQTMHLIVRNDKFNYDDFEKDKFTFVPLIGEEGWED